MRFPSLFAFYTLGIKSITTLRWALPDGPRRQSVERPGGSRNNLVQATDADRPLYVTGDTPVGPRACISTRQAISSPSWPAPQCIPQRRTPSFFVVKRLADSARLPARQRSGTAGVTLKSTTGNRRVTPEQHIAHGRGVVRQLRGPVLAHRGKRRLWHGSGHKRGCTSTACCRAPRRNTEPIAGHQRHCDGRTGSTGAFRFAELAGRLARCYRPTTASRSQRDLMQKHGVT